MTRQLVVETLTSHLVACEPVLAMWQAGSAAFGPVLGMRYRPERWGFGLRYLKEDMPPDVVDVVERLGYVPGPALVEERLAEADTLFACTLAELAEYGTIPPDSSGIDVLVPQFTLGATRV